MNEVQFIKHRIFRETDAVVFYDISVEESNAADLVIHDGSAISPPDDCVGAKSFYIHSFQDDYNRVVQGSRTFELVNLQWKYPYHLVNLTRQSGGFTDTSWYISQVTIRRRRFYRNQPSKKV